MNETKITEYSKVPWFRRNGFVFVAWLLCWPVAVIVFWTGEVYYQRKGEVRTYGKVAKGILTFIAVSMTMGFLNEGNQQQTAIEESAVPIVTEIIQENLGPEAPSCRVVKLGKEVSDGFYRATAILDGGTELDITVELDGDQIMVRVPLEQ